MKKNEFILNLEKMADEIIHSGSEPTYLDQIQEDIHKFDIEDNDPLNKTQNKYDKSTISAALNELYSARTIVEMLLLRSFSTFKSDKYQFIYFATANLIKWLSLSCQYESVLHECEYASVYFEDSIESAPDDFNIISGVVNILYYELCAKIHTQISYSETIQKLRKFLPYLRVSADKDKYRLNVILLLLQIADILQSESLYPEACEFYEEATNVIPELDTVDIDAKSILSLLYGRYNIAYMSLEKHNKAKLKENLEKEVALYADLCSSRTSVENLMGLAIAYSHLGDFFMDSHGIKQRGVYNLKKLRLIVESFSLSYNKSDYTIEFRVESICNSMQPIINFALSEGVSPNVDIMKEVVNLLEVCVQYTNDIRITQYINSFLMELFKTLSKSDTMDAEFYLFKKIKSLLDLVRKYGKEEGIITDLEDTLKMSQNFIVNHKLRKENLDILLCICKICDLPFPLSECLDGTNVQLNITESLLHDIVVKKTYAETCQREGEHKKALDLFRQIIDLYGNYITNTALHIDLLNSIGFIYDDLGNYSLALDSYNEGLHIARDILNSSQKSAEILFNMGSTYVNLGDYGMAMKYYEMSDEILSSIEKPDTDIYVRLLLNFGALLNDKLDMKWKAAYMYKKALIMYESKSAKDKETLANLYNNLAIATDDWSDKKQFFFKAQDIYHNLNCIEKLAQSYNALGTACEHRHDYFYAFKYYYLSFVVLVSKFGTDNSIVKSYVEDLKYVSNILNYCGILDTVVDSDFRLKNHTDEEEGSICHKLYKKLADAGDKETQYLWANILLHKDENVEEKSIALTYLESSANAGYAPSQYILGKYFYEGEFVEPKLAKAIYWLKKASDQGYAPAQYYLGHIYFSEGNLGKTHKAMPLLQQSADAYYEPAFGLLSWILHLKHNDNNALKWAILAASSYPEDSNIRGTLGHIYKALGRYEDSLREFSRRLELLLSNNAPEDSISETKTQIDSLRQLINK